VVGVRLGATVRTVTSTTLAERLGYGPDDRLLIINCDDLGSSHAANVGVYEALREGLATSATLMVPCPWAREAAARYRGEDVGVHLTLNAEWDLYRWGPITHGPSLLDGDGGFPRTVADVWDHADLDEVRRELRAQIERAILWGFDVSHLDSHMGTLQLRPEFFDVYLELAVDFGLPLRLSGASSERVIGFPFRRLAAEEGVLFPDHFIHVRGGVGSRRWIERALFELRPGVTEVYLHPAVDTDELRALAPDWPNRVDDHAFIVRDSELRSMIRRAGVQLIGYREVRELMRKGG
jgi:chitin disaccharide deacetylase